MKTEKVSQDKVEFEPLTLNITFETIEEAQGFFAIFNSSINSSIGISNDEAEVLRDLMTDHCEEIYNEMGHSGIIGRIKSNLERP